MKHISMNKKPEVLYTVMTRQKLSIVFAMGILLLMLKYEYLRRLLKRLL